MLRLKDCSAIALEIAPGEHDRDVVGLRGPAAVHPCGMHDGRYEFVGLAVRYRVALLDEYQDTNPGQREMLRALFRNNFV